MLPDDAGCTIFIAGIVENKVFGLFQQAPLQQDTEADAVALKWVVLAIALISGVVNLLALTSPLFMLQVYDRVLASGSVETLVGLAILAAAMFIIQAALDIIRARVLTRLGELFDNRLSERAHNAVLRLPLVTKTSGDGMQPLRDMDNIRGFLAGSGPTAFFDLPFMPLYLSICFVFHFWIGMTALIGATVLIAVTILTNVLSRKPVRDAMTHNMRRNGLLEDARRNAEIIRAMGIGKRVALRWSAVNREYLDANRAAADVSGLFGSISRMLRIILQSALLGVGAYLVIRQEVSGGVMIASSIMMGRALAPVDLVIASWKPLLMARQSWSRLRDLLTKIPADRVVMDLPSPVSELRTQALVIIPPGDRKPTVSGIEFTVRAGSGLGVIGASGSGKSTLVRALVNAWVPASGKVRLDGASLDQWDPQRLGRHIGYLPQAVELFDGTIAENISRFDEEADPVALVAAAKAAGVHDLILLFENGYETRVGESGSALSAGQRQRIGLARALYRDPFIVVLDEPNANLDADGEAAVVSAIASVRQRGGIAVVVAHRPSAIAAVDMVLVMEAGRQRAFGERNAVLSKVLQKAGPAETYPQGFQVTGSVVIPIRAGTRQETQTAQAGVMDVQAQEHSDV